MSARRVAAQTVMELKLLLRNGENLLVTLGIPVAMLVFFGLVDVLPADGSRVDFLVPGVLTLSAMGSAMVSLGIATGFERSYLVLKRLGATPLRRTEIVLAKAFATLGILVVQVVVIAFLGALLGWRAGGSWVPAVVALAAGGLAFAGIGLAVAGRLPALGALAAINALFAFLLLISGLLFPLTSLPDPLAAFARLLPPAALAEVLRSVFEAGVVPVAPSVVLGVWAVAMPLLAGWLFRWE